MKKLSSKLFGSLALAALFCASMSFSTSVNAEDYTVANVDVVVADQALENLEMAMGWYIISRDYVYMTAPTSK